MLYPENPNNMMKKKYYELFSNLPLFLPETNIANYFLKLLDKYPIEPYLTSRISLMKWLHFIHNKINEKCGKKILGFNESLELYYNHYKPKNIIDDNKKKMKKIYINIGTIIGMFFLIIYIYNK
tara:strand:- start:4 stop:375 length:372 start_codon:yes stop_codon:yes gene_type:complete